MAIETAVKIDVDVNGIQTVQQAATVYEDLGDAVAKTQREAEALALQFGINDKRTQEAIKVAGQYKKQLEELDFAIDANRGGIDQLFRATQGVAAGFEVAAGAAAIFGTNSEDLEKILVRVQAAMVFSQGLRDLKEFAPAILNIAKATRAWFISLSLIQKAFLTLGIGLLIDLVYNLANAWNSVAEKTNLATKEQQAYNDELRKLKQEQKLIIEGEKAVVEENLKATTARLKAGREEVETQKKINEDFFRSQKILRGEIDKDELNRRNKRIKAKELENEKLYLEELKLAKRLQELKAQEVKSTTQVAKQGLTDEQKAKIEFEQWLSKERERSTKALEGVQGQQLQNLDFTISQQTQKIVDANAIIISQATDNSVSSIDRLKMGYDLFAQDTYSTFVNIFEAIAQLELAFGNESEKSQKKAFEIRKGIALANATITSIEATLNAFDTAQDSPITAFFPAYPFVQAGIAAAFGIAKIQQIRNQKYQGASTPSTGSVPSTGGNLNTFNAPTTRLPQGQDILTQERRVYVLEGDITRTQRRAATNQNVSVLGG